MPNLLTPEERCFIEEEYEVWVQQQTNLALFDGHFFSQKSFEESFIMPVTERLCTTYREGVPLNCCDRDAIAGYCEKLHQWPTGTRAMPGGVRQDNLNDSFGHTQWLSYWRSSPDGITTTTSQSPNTEELFAWMEETAGSIEEAARIAVEKSHVELSAHADAGAPLAP
ncbi:hypothetical protein FA13DRAFT_1798031 [Coprinellus micaceus]|uniref:Uncharacterized protein n=1 Tax=Coprinellus micaceus TaxID=71717 RepID=A0A4Y7SP52_COPMI|nr:hypothetical protein FA13DRAFT_1798031 [Coprinellus micaceus]